MKIKYTDIKLIVFSIGFLSIVISCTNNTGPLENSTFDRLCQIYEDVVQQPIDLNMKEMKITERIQKELPAFFEKSYAQLVSSDPDFRYNFIKRMADMKTKNTWECESMRAYYANEFNNPPNQ